MNHYTNKDLEQMEPPFIIILLILFVVFIAVPIILIIIVYTGIKYEIQHPVYYTYETVQGTTGEAQSCGSTYGELKCRLSDGTVVSVMQYKRNRR